MGYFLQWYHAVFFRSKKYPTPYIWCAFLPYVANVSRLVFALEIRKELWRKFPGLKFTGRIKSRGSERVGSGCPLSTRDVTKRPDP